MYHLGPGDVRLGPLFEFVMTLLNLLLLFGIWQRKVSAGDDPAQPPPLLGIWQGKVSAGDDPARAQPPPLSRYLAGQGECW